MSKLNEFQKKAEGMRDQIQQLRLEKQMKEGMIGQKKQEKVELVLSSIGTKVDEKKVEKLNSDVEKLEKEVKEIDERISLFEEEAKQILARDLDAVKAERKEMAQDFNKQIEAMEAELFEEKLKFLSKVQDLHFKKMELQEQLDEVTSAINQVDPRDRGVKVKDIVFVRDNYRAIGGIDSPIAPQSSEIESITVPSSVHGRLFTLELFRKTGEVTRSEREAQQKLSQLKKK